MPINSAKLDEVRKILLSLLLARPGSTSVAVLDQDYYEVEGERIPWRKFGFADLVDFLSSMPEHFVIEWYNGGHHVRGIASEKTKHVSSLVSRQKLPPKSKYIPPRFRQSNVNNRFPNRLPQMQRARVRVTAEQLSYIVAYVRNKPKGISMRNVILMLQKRWPHITVSMYDMREQLRELSHFLYLDCDMIYPKSSVNDVSRNVKNHPQSSTSQNVPRSPARETVCVGGEEGSDFSEELDDEGIFVPSNYVSNNYPKQSQTSGRIAASFPRSMNNEQNAMLNHNDDVDDDNYLNDLPEIASLIDNRTKSRLDQLIRKHPEGIWCADLPEQYFKEYNVHLNYKELGFMSVRDYVSYLTNIFYMTQENLTGDFLLYTADNRPIVPDQDSRTESTDKRSSSCEQYDEHNGVRRQYDNDDNAPIPADVSPTITKIFAPEDTMNYNDSVDQISVTDLQSTGNFLEVYIVEIFHPTFFWIHLRENRKDFDKLMGNLHNYYQRNKDKYTIPKIALKKGLNCACIYAGKWHRGIIKSVKPDFRVTIMFYDYGTLKTYASEDVYYLHKQFCYLPAQAIPCGLYNVRPCVGDRWKKSVIDQLVDRISETLLALTIISVDPSNNSMMVILTDTSEEEDVHINDWLINEKLARCGKMVRMCDNFSYLHYTTCNNINVPSPTSVPIAHDKMSESDIESDIENVDETRQDQSIPCKKTHTLFNVKSENNVTNENKTFESNLKALLQKLRDNNSLNAESSDTKSQSTNSSTNERPNGPGEFAPFEKLRTLNVTSNSNPSISTSKSNHDFKDDIRQIDSDMKANSHDDNEKHCALNVDFTLRDSDNEDNNEKDFGTFRSLYGGHGMMEPFDWKVIQEKNELLRETNAASHNNLNALIKEYKNNVTEDESESHDLNNLEKKSPLNPYFFNLTRREEEYYLPERNFNYGFKNVSQSVARLRSRMEIQNDQYTTVLVPRRILDILCGNYDDTQVQSEDTSNSAINPAKTNGVASPVKMTPQSQVINENNEAYGTRTEIENRDFATDDVKSNASNMINNEDKNETTRINNKKMFECNTDSSSECSTPGNPRYKVLLDQMKRMQMNSMHSNTSMDLSSKRDSPSSDQVPWSSYSHSNSTTSSTMISSDDEQHSDVRNQSSMRFIKLCNLSKLSTSSSDFSLDCNSKETKCLLSSDDSVSSFSTNDSKQNHSVEIDSIASTVDNSEHSNATVERPRNLKNMLELVLKNMENASSDVELDSDDLSNQESVASDKKESELVDELVVDRVKCKSPNNDVNVLEETLVPPVLNDCDIESDESEWDGDAVDMASIMKYVVNNLNQLPTYCFAEESLMSDSRCCKATSTEELHEVPLVSSKQTHPCGFEQHTVRPPPGFAPLDKKPSLSSTSTISSSDTYSFGNTPNVRTPSYGNEATNPFLNDQQLHDNVISNDAAKQIFTPIWSENMQLFIKLTEILYDLLGRSPLNRSIFENHMSIQHHLNKFLRNFEETLAPDSDRSTIGTSSASLKKETSSKVDSVEKMPVNSNAESFVNQNLAGMSNLSLNPFDDDKLSQTHNMFSAYGSNGYTFGWHQSDRFSPHIQVTPISPSPATPTPMFANYGPAANVFLPNPDQGNENPSATKPISSTVPNADICNNNHNSSAFNFSANNEFAKVIKETNPFKFSMINNMQMPEKQNEWMANNCDTNATSYQSVKNLNDQSSKMETVNVNAGSKGFPTTADHVNVNGVDYTPKIVYEAGPVMYNVQKKEADVKRNSDFKNDANVPSREHCNKELSSQSVNDGLYLKHDSYHIDEAYVSRLPTDYTSQNSPPIINESIYHQQNKVNERVLSSQAWKKVEIPERWMNSHFPNDTSLQNHNSVKNATLIFHSEGEGWILTQEFVQIFTHFKTCSYMISMLETMHIKATFKQVQRSDYPVQFLQLDHYPLHAIRDSNMRIESIHLISLQSALSLLHKLKIVTREEIDNAFKKNEFVRGSVLPDMWMIIVIYRDLKRRIEQCNLLI
ncbi:Tudor domain-containing protein 5 [Camponotus floridanus]|uniref:Tudor domain-containing protein 5 n=1 Tax=Camponotus floridanus TaxID=104421 RepID=E2AA01_CAMFO|nr:Tudor domain-containing protein 5 [Camponotus floridanus]